MPINHDMMHAQSPDDMAALKARIAELEAENIKLIAENIKLSDNCSRQTEKLCIEKENVWQLEKAWMETRRDLWLARAERYDMREFIAREESNMRDHIAWSQYLRARTYKQWVDQLLRIANLANKLQKKCRAKAEEYK